MIKFHPIFLILFFMFLTSCEEAEIARVVVVEQESGRDEQFRLYLDLTLENPADTPAYFVIALVDVYHDGKSIAYNEQAFGDLFPGEQKTERLIFPSVTQQDDLEFDVEITFNLNQL